MSVNDVLIDAFGRVQEAVHAAAEGLSDQTLTYRPGKDANSLAWLVWHLARIQDDHIADAAGTAQVWTSGGWAKKFDLPFDASATGYGMHSDEVALVKASAEQLLGYYDAVHVETIKYIGGLHSADYERIVDTRWNPPVTLAVRLVSIISDNLQHAGQAAYLRGLV